MGILSQVYRRWFSPLGLSALGVPALVLSGAAQAAEVEGIWQSTGYGNVYVVTQETAQKLTVQRYELAGPWCVKAVKSSWAEFTAEAGDFGSLPAVDGVKRARLVRPPTQESLQALAALPAACAKPLQSKEALANLDYVAATFQQFYPVMAQRGKDWPARLAQAKQRVAGKEGLLPVLDNLLRVLNDGHVSLDAGKETPDEATVLLPNGGKTRWKQRREDLRNSLQSNLGETGRLLAPVELAGNRRLLVGQLAGEIGYLAVLAEGGWAEGLTEDKPVALHRAATARVLDEVLQKLSPDGKPLRGMVVDLRVNSGGFDGVALELASRFTEKPLVFGLKEAGEDKGRYEMVLDPASGRRFSGPVAVLIGPNTVSAGETAALAFQAMPHARLFGQTTRGILSDAIPKRLPNGWSFTLPMERIYAPGGELLEAKGITPHQVVAEEDWFAAMAAAAQWLRAQP